MKRTKSDRALWKPAHILAAELAQWGTDANLVKTAAAVMKDNPELDFLDWLERLARLGDLFRSSDKTGLYRQQLRHVCLKIQAEFALHAGADWAWVLAWAGRLMPYYTSALSRATTLSPIQGDLLDPLPPPFQRSQPTTRKPKESEPLEQPSQKALDLWAQIQQHSEEKAKRKKSR